MSAEFKRAKSARKVATRDASAKQSYWIGTKEDAPKQDIFICGTGFLRWSSQVIPQDEEIPHKKYEVSGRKPGMIVSLSAAEIERIKDRAELKVVRWSNAVEIRSIGADGKAIEQEYRRGRIVSLEETHENAAQPVQLPGDEPITKYIYLKPLANMPRGFVPAYGTPTPDSLWADMEKSGENQKRLEARLKREAAEDVAEQKAEIAKTAAVELIKKGV
jgi:hypothetical protein